MAYPSVYPTGTTIFEPDECWSGYTVFPASDVGATVIDMNGEVVKQIKGLYGMPCKMLPGGFFMGNTGTRNPKYGFQDGLDLVQVDWDGNVVWKFNRYELVKDPRQKAKWMARQHHAHMIPRGLPGEGNVLVFDNGGWAGYGAPNPGSYTGRNNALRDFSRVLEFDPITLEVVWRYTPSEAGFVRPVDAYKFYSGFISSAQRLPNGNTLITEGADGRVFEVTSKHEIVWEYISPYFDKGGTQNMVYRAYRLPYDWIPQLPRPEERPTPRLDNSKFRVTGSEGKGVPATTIQRGGKVSPELCVMPQPDED